MTDLENRHPYLYARERYMAGELHTLSARALVASDRDVIAESELNGLTPLEGAKRIVETWRRKLARNEQLEIERNS